MHAADRARYSLHRARRINSAGERSWKRSSWRRGQDRFPFRWNEVLAPGKAAAWHRGAAPYGDPVVRSTRHMERPTSGAGCHVQRQLGDGGIKISLPGAHRESHDQSAANFFLDVDDDLRFAELFRHWPTCRQFPFSFRRGLCADRGPRFARLQGSRMRLGVFPRRQLVRCEEYKPPGEAAHQLHRECGGRSASSRCQFCTRWKRTSLGLATITDQLATRSQRSARFAAAPLRAGSQASLRSVPWQSNPRGKKQHQENSHFRVGESPACGRLLSLAVSALRFVPGVGQPWPDRCSLLTDPHRADYRSGFPQTRLPSRSRMFDPWEHMGGDAGFVPISPTSTTSCEFGD